MPADEAGARTGVRSVRRAFAVLTAFSQQRPAMTLSEVAQATDLDRSTARRLLLTLIELGYVAEDGRREFRLTPRILELGYSYLSSTGLVDVARPHLQRLATELGESATLTVLDGDDVVYVAFAPGPHVVAVRITIGTRFAAYATSMGRVLLAQLDDEALEAYLGRVQPDPLTDRTPVDPDRLRELVQRARRDGFAVADGEVDPRLRGLAVPVLDRGGRAVAAVNISLHADGSDRAELEGTHLPALQATARRIGEELTPGTL